MVNTQEFIRRSLWRCLRQNRGSEVISVLAPMVVVFLALAASVIVWHAYTNAMLAQNALSQTSLYVGSRGVWTEQLQNKCLQQLPGNGPKSCRVYKYSGTTLGPEIQPACPGRATVGDCLNEAASTGAFALYGERLVVRVAYTQNWIRICSPFSSGGCMLDGESLIEREMLVFSQTRRTNS